MANLQCKQVDNNLNHKAKTSFPLGIQEFLSLKHGSKNRHESLNQLIKAYVLPRQQLTNKTRLLHPKARIIAERILNKLSHAEVKRALLTHKQCCVFKIYPNFKEVIDISSKKMEVSYA